MEMVNRSKQEMKDKWEMDASNKERLRIQMEQDLAWRNIKKRDEKD